MIAVNMVTEREKEKGQQLFQLQSLLTWNYAVESTLRKSVKKKNFSMIYAHTQKNDRKFSIQPKNFYEKD